MRAIKVLFTLGAMLFGFTSVASAQASCDRIPQRIVAKGERGTVSVNVYINAPLDRVAEYREAKMIDTTMTFWIAGHQKVFMDRAGYVKSVGLCTFGSTKKTYATVWYKSVPGRTTNDMLVGLGEMPVAAGLPGSAPQAGFSLPGGAEFVGTWGSERVGNKVVPTLTFAAAE